jgi:hypothetical protein
MPALSLALKPKGRGASVRKAKNRYRHSLRQPEEGQARVPEEVRETSSDLQQEMLAALPSLSPEGKRPDLRDAFTRAAEGPRAKRSAARARREASPASRCRGHRGRVSAGARTGTQR